VKGERRKDGGGRGRREEGEEDAREEGDRLRVDMMLRGRQKRMKGV
jgi:hypothetical protein